MFESDKDINTVTKKFLKRLDGIISNSFKKIKIKEHSNKEIAELFKKRKLLRTKIDAESKDALKKVEDELDSKCAEDNRNRIKEELAGMKCEEGGINSGKLWSLRKKIFPRSRDPPTAMCDAEGNLVTNEAEIEQIAVETYKMRLSNRPMKANLENIRKDKEELCSRRLETAAKNKTQPWTMDQLNDVLKYLKRNKSRDPLGYANEIFRPEVAGNDFKVALLKLLNRIKAEQMLPKVLELCDISSIWKKKASINDFENYRGIFRVTTIRSILDRLIYNDEYVTIDSNLTDSNVGARKGRNIRDNIFVLNAVINSVRKGKEEPIDAQLFDIEKCFDALWLSECINDLYDAGVENDNLALLYNSNKNAKVAIKTAQSVSKIFDIQDIVLQGSVWGSIFCTTSIDKLGQIAYENEDLLYMYKGQVAVPPISMVDDILCITKCSDSAKINTTVKAFVETKKLTLSKSKCNRIHIGKNVEPCPELKTHNER